MGEVALMWGPCMCNVVVCNAITDRHALRSIFYDPHPCSLSHSIPPPKAALRLQNNNSLFAITKLPPPPPPPSSCICRRRCHHGELLQPLQLLSSPPPLLPLHSCCHCCRLQKKGGREVTAHVATTNTDKDNERGGCYCQLPR